MKKFLTKFSPLSDSQTNMENSEFQSTTQPTPIVPITPKVSESATEPVLETPSSKSSGFLKTFFIIIALILFGILIGVVAARFLPMPTGSTIPTPTPTIEITPSPTLIPSPTVEEKPSLITYEHPELGFTLQYPNLPNWNSEKTNQSGAIYSYDVSSSSGREYDPAKDKGKFKIEFRQNDTFAKCDHWFVDYNSSVDERTGQAPKISSLKQYSNQQFTGMFFENESYVGKIGVVCINSPKGGTINFFGLLDYQNNKELFSQIIESIKFTQNTTYSCPENGWVSCMPVLDAAGQKACSAEAMAWYKANCPNFQGAAL